MGWATGYIAKLQQGQTVSFRPRGTSMTGRIASGQLCTVAPVGPTDVLEVDDVVLCKVRGAEYLHLIKAITNSSPLSGAPRFQIGNNRGHVNGWIGARAIYGRLVSVAD